jgi:hypothetical protein
MHFLFFFVAHVLAVLSQFKAAIVLVLREGCVNSDQSLICRYVNGKKWWTTKRKLRADEAVPIPGSTNPRNARRK